jgi:hypothetical protein
MSARIYVHPRCVTDTQARETFQATLAERGWDLERAALIGPPVRRKHHELVRIVCEHEDGSHTYEQGDGVQFRHPVARSVA